eukprot:718443-Karenia_brevis.AAC.1
MDVSKSFVKEKEKRKNETLESMIRDNATHVTFGNNPHKHSESKAHLHFEHVKSVSTNIKEARQAGATTWNLRKWFESGSLVLVNDGVRIEESRSTGGTEVDSAKGRLSAEEGKESEEIIVGRETNVVEEKRAGEALSDSAVGELAGDKEVAGKGLFVFGSAGSGEDPGGRKLMEDPGLTRKERAADFESEPHQQVKKARNDHIDTIRKLEKVKERLSPMKHTFHGAAFHDEEYDPSREMRSMLPGLIQKEQQRDFEMHAFDSPRDANFDSSRGASSSSNPASIQDIARLLDQKLQPVHTSMNNLETQFTNLYLQVDHQIHDLQTKVEK